MKNFPLGACIPGIGRGMPLPPHYTLSSSAHRRGRPKHYLTDKEVTRLMKAASKTGRHGHRDSTLILVTYRHSFRVSELVALSWSQVELDGGQMHVNRSKDGSRSVHPIRGPEIRALRRLKRDYPETPYVFVT